MAFWRMALFNRTIWIIVWSVHVYWVVVSVVIGFIINIVAICVTLAGRWRASIRCFTIDTTFIRAVTVGTVIIWAFIVRSTCVRLTVAVIIAPILVRTIWPVIIRIVIEVRQMAFWLFFQGGSDWFILSKWDCDPAMVVVYAGPLSRVYVHQRLFVGNHLVQLLQLTLLPCQLIVHDSNTSGRRTHLPPSLVTFFALSADLAPPLVGPVLAPLPAPAATPAGALASAATLLGAVGVPV